ncbi:MAG: hypothetical protein NZ585_11460 [Chloracidobacterium sp.]|nr:hypothetical protein [Chloracidobacterium sp.]MDW8218132.1 hypothetical protein [Acidobacteriota bacterium]
MQPSCIVRALVVGAMLGSMLIRPAVAQSPVGRVVKVPPRVSIQSFRFDPPEIVASEYGNLARLRVIARLDLNDGDRGSYEVTFVAIPFGQTGFADVRVKDIAKSVTFTASQPVQEIEFEFRAFRNEQQTTDVEVGAEVEIPVQPQQHLPYQVRGFNPRVSDRFRRGELLTIRKP